MTVVRKKFDDVAGRICEVLIPVRYATFLGKGNEIAICALGSIDLLREISRSPLMDRVILAGRLLSENRGIDAIIRFSVKNPELRRIVVCGKDVRGHFAGQSLLALYKNGVDENNRIIGARGQYPILESPKAQIISFRKQVVMDNLIGVTDLKSIFALVS